MGLPSVDQVFQGAHESQKVAKPKEGYILKHEPLDPKLMILDHVNEWNSGALAGRRKVGMRNDPVYEDSYWGLPPRPHLPSSYLWSPFFDLEFISSVDPKPP